MANRNTARAVGALFLIATAAYMAGSGLADRILNQPDFLAILYPDRMKVYAGLLLQLINSAAVVAIAVLMFPLLKRHNESIALGYFGSRLVESTLLVASIIVTLALVGLSEDYIAEGSPAAAYPESIGKLALMGQDMAFELAMAALGLGSVMFCFLLYRTKLVPRAMSVLGLIGYLLLLLSSCLSMAGYSIGMVLFIPGGLFEIIFPIWLITKGFHNAK